MPRRHHPPRRFIAATSDAIFAMFTVSLMPPRRLPRAIISPRGVIYEPRHAEPPPPPPRAVTRR